MVEKVSVPVPVETVESKILSVRGQQVIIDSDLAKLYGVSTSRLNEQVKRNIERFPADFMFQLKKAEFENLKSQFATSSSGWGGRRKLPYAFTEHGAIMAASVLNSKRAVAVSIYVVRAFLQLRQILIPYKELKPRLEQLEKRLRAHDEQIAALAAIQQLISAIEEKPKSQIGYLTEAKGHRKKVKKRKRKKRKTKGRKK